MNKEKDKAIQRLNARLRNTNVGSNDGGDKGNNDYNDEMEEGGEKEKKGERREDKKYGGWERGGYEGLKDREGRSGSGEAKYYHGRYEPFGNQEKKILVMKEKKKDMKIYQKAWKILHLIIKRMKILFKFYF
jgi:hypothetical protein